MSTYMYCSGTGGEVSSRGIVMSTYMYCSGSGGTVNDRVIVRTCAAAAAV